MNKKTLQQHKKSKLGNIVINDSLKGDIINSIKQYSPEEIKNTPNIKKEYSIWQRITRALGMR